MTQILLNTVYGKIRCSFIWPVIHGVFVSYILVNLNLSLQGFPSGLLNKGSRDYLCGVKEYLGFVVLKSLKPLPMY